MSIPLWVSNRSSSISINAYLKCSGILSNETGKRFEPSVISFSITFPSESYILVASPAGTIFIVSISGAPSIIPFTIPNPRKPTAPASRISANIETLNIPTIILVVSRLDVDVSSLCFFTILLLP